MLAGIRHQQHAPTGQRLRDAPRRDLTGRKFEPKRRGHGGGTTSGSASDDNSASHLPSANSGNNRRAFPTASRVLPMPQAPVRPDEPMPGDKAQTLAAFEVASD